MIAAGQGFLVVRADGSGAASSDAGRAPGTPDARDIEAGLHVIDRIPAA